MDASADNLRYQWQAVAKFTFFAELCRAKNVEKYSKDLNEAIVYTDELLLEAWQLTLEIFKTVDEMVCLDRDQWVDFMPAVSVEAITSMLKVARQPTDNAIHAHAAFWHILDTVVDMYKNPRLYNADPFEHLNEIKEGLGGAVVQLNGMANILGGASSGDPYTREDHLALGGLAFYTALTLPNFDWNREVHASHGLGSTHVFYLFHRALVTLLIAAHFGPASNLRATMLSPEPDFLAMVAYVEVDSTPELNSRGASAKEVDVPAGAEPDLSGPGFLTGTGPEFFEHTVPLRGGTGWFDSPGVVFSSAMVVPPLA